MNRCIAVTLLILPLCFLGGCAMQREPAWQQAGLDRPTERTDNLYAAARSCFSSASDAAAVDVCIALHETVLKDNPGHYQARVNAASLFILKGTAYTKSSAEKSRLFALAMTYAEFAMYNNPAFKARVDAGQQPWEAADSLAAAETEAMFFWVTALQYEFKEGMSLPSKIVNIEWLRRGLTFLNRIAMVAPEYGGGAVEFAKAICYIALPESLGGSKTKGDALVQKSVERADGWLFSRWARGKYFFPHMGEQEAATADLKWVATQDPAAFRDPYPWRVHFQQDARQRLN